MKLLFVLHQFLPRHVTGTEQYVRSLALGLRARGHDVDVFAWEPRIDLEAPGATWFARDEEVDGIAVHRVAVHPDTAPNQELIAYENPIAAALLGEWLARGGYDVVHVFHLHGIGAAGIEEPRARGIPVVVSLMDYWFLCARIILRRGDGELCEGPPQGGLGCVPCVIPGVATALRFDVTSPVWRALAGDGTGPGESQHGPAARAHAIVRRLPRLLALLARAQLVLAPSRFLLQQFRAAGYDGPIEHLPYGVDTGRLAGLAPRPADGRLVLGYLGSLTPHKGVHVLVDAVRALDDPSVELQIYGDPATHPQYVAELRARADEDPRIRFCGAFGPTRLGAALAEVDAVVVPSLWHENTPFSVLEALAAGRPVVASDVGGIAEIVAHEQNGLLVPCGDARALALALARLRHEQDLLGWLAGAVPVPTLEQNLDALVAHYAQLAPVGTRR